MKYICNTCKRKCDDIPEHLMTEHKFSKTIIESQLKANPNSYEERGSFEISLELVSELEIILESEVELIFSIDFKAIGKERE